MKPFGEYLAENFSAKTIRGIRRERRRAAIKVRLKDGFTWFVVVGLLLAVGFMVATVLAVGSAMAYLDAGICRRSGEVRESPTGLQHEYACGDGERIWR
jgi:hypothetical protein